jgi:hypothetical protein
VSWELKLHLYRHWLTASDLRLFRNAGNSTARTIGAMGVRPESVRGFLDHARAIR